jgi:hypothetical protein
MSLLCCCIQCCDIANHELCHNLLIGLKANELLCYFASARLNAGVHEQLCFRALASFASLPVPAAANQDVGFSIVMLLSLVATAELAKMTRAKVEEGGGIKMELLRKHLIYAVEHGTEAPRDRTGQALEVTAANILALLYGREEKGEAGTVRVFRLQFTLEDATGSHACSFEALVGM